MEIKFTSAIKTELVQSVGGDAMVIAAAKVSTTGEKALRFATTPAEENYGLINYLMKNRHGSVFEHAFLTFFVHAPIFVWREWHRHRVGFSYNETSGRYAEIQPIFWIPSAERKIVPAPDHKSARPSFQKEPAIHQRLVAEMKKSYADSYASYKTMLALNVAKEVARAVLPVGIYSSCWVSCNPRSLMAFLSLRTYEPTATFPSRPQAEIEEAARACETVFAQGWPLTYRAFCENGRVGP